MQLNRRGPRRLVILPAPVVVRLAIAVDFPSARNRGSLTTVAAGSVRPRPPLQQSVSCKRSSANAERVSA